MTAWLASLFCVVASSDDAAKSELLAHAKKFVEAASYTASVETHRTTVPPSDEPEKNLDPWTVEFQSGQAIRCTRGAIDLWRGEKKTAYQESKGRKRWIGVDRVRAASDAKDNESGEKVRGIQKWIVELERIALPHEFLASLSTVVGDVKREEKDGKVLYTATCSDEFARQFALRMSRKRPDATKDDDKDDKKDEKKGPNGSATLRVVVVKEAIESYEVELVVKGGAVERHTLDHWTVSAVGATKVTVPDDVTAALNSK
jgi:hypothetical protein